MNPFYRWFRRRPTLSAVALFIAVVVSQLLRPAATRPAVLTFHEGPPPDSMVHCTGDVFGYQPIHPWLFRSCEFRNLCYDTTDNEFVVFPSRQEEELARLVQKHPLVSITSVASSKQQVSLGAVDPPNPADPPNLDGVKANLAWFPKIRYEKPSLGYYQLEEHHVLVPFQESIPLTEESITQRDFLSVFALLYIFGLEEKTLVLKRHGSRPCDSTCQQKLSQHLPLLELPLTSKSSLVCAKFGAAGIGMLMTGERPLPGPNGDWYYTHTVGRDATLKAFDEYLTRWKLAS